MDAKALRIANSLSDCLFMEAKLDKRFGQMECNMVIDGIKYTKLQDLMDHLFQKQSEQIPQQILFSNEYMDFQRHIIQYSRLTRSIEVEIINLDRRIQEMDNRWKEIDQDLENDPNPTLQSELFGEPVNLS